MWVPVSFVNPFHKYLKVWTFFKRHTFSFSVSHSKTKSGKCYIVDLQNSSSNSFHLCQILRQQNNWFFLTASDYNMCILLNQKDCINIWKPSCKYWITWCMRNLEAPVQFGKTYTFHHRIFSFFIFRIFSFNYRSYSP